MQFAVLRLKVSFVPIMINCGEGGVVSQDTKLLP